MRKLLRNPLAVLIMALLAIGIVYQNIFAPLKKHHIVSDLQSPVLETNTAVNPRSKETSLLWLPKRHARNPFSPPLHQRTSRHQQGLTLSAILSDNQSSLALINGKLVNIGDKLAGFTIRAIHHNYVLISGSKGEKKLYLPKHFRRNP